MAVSSLPIKLNIEVQPRSRVKVNTEIQPPVVARLRAPEDMAEWNLFATITLVDMHNREHKFIVGQNTASAMSLDVPAAYSDAAEGYRTTFFVFPNLKVREEGKFRFLVTAFYMDNEAGTKIASKYTTSFEVDKTGGNSSALTQGQEIYVEALENEGII